MNFKSKSTKLWIKELNTKTKLENKIKEVKEELNYYKKICKLNNWNCKVSKNNIKEFTNFIIDLETLLKEKYY